MAWGRLGEGGLSPAELYLLGELEGASQGPRVPAGWAVGQQALWNHREFSAGPGTGSGSRWQASRGCVPPLGLTIVRNTAR